MQFENFPHLITYAYLADPEDSKIPFIITANLPIDILHHSLQLILFAKDNIEPAPIEAFYFALHELNKINLEADVQSFKDISRLFRLWGTERVFRYEELKQLNIFTKTENFYEYLYEMYLNLELRRSSVNLEQPEQVFYYFAKVNSGQFIFPHLFSQYLKLHKEIRDSFLKTLLKKETIEEITNLYNQSLESCRNNRMLWKGNDFTQHLEEQLQEIVSEKAKQYQEQVRKSGIQDLLAEIDLHQNPLDTEKLASPIKLYSKLALNDLEQIISNKEFGLKKVHRIPVIYLIRKHREILTQHVEEHLGFFNLVKHFSRTEAHFKDFFLSTCQISFDFVFSRIAENNIRIAPDRIQKKVLRIMFRPSKYIEYEVPFLNSWVRGLLFGADQATSLLFYKTLTDKIAISKEYGATESAADILWKLFLNFYPFYLYALRSEDAHKKQDERSTDQQTGLPREPIFSPEQVANLVQTSPNQDNQYLLHQIIDKLDCLEQSQKELIIMRELNGLSFKEIGEQLGISRQAVKKRYDKAILELRAKF